MRRLLLAAMVALFTATPAFAQTSHAASKGGATMDNQLSIWGVFAYHYYDNGFGLGVRYQKAVVPDGVLHNANVKDDIGIEGGIDWVHYSWGTFGYNVTINEFAPVIGGVWNFWLTPQFALYPKLDLGYRIASVTWPNTYFGSTSATGSEFFVQGAAGLVYKLTNVTLRAELGSSYLRAGVGFAF